jgi:hypothetical protein
VVRRQYLSYLETAFEVNAMERSRYSFPSYDQVAFSHIHAYALDRLTPARTRWSHLILLR